MQEAINKASINADYYSGKLKDNRLKTAIKGSLEYYLDRLRIIEEVEDHSPIYLSKPIKEKLGLCMSGVNDNKDFMKILKPEGLLTPPQVFNEYAIFCEVIITIDGVATTVKLKAKLDNFTIDTENEVLTLNDLKSSGKPVKFFMGNWVKELDENGEEKTRWYNGSFQRYHYYRQMGMYLFLLQAAIKQYYGFEYKLANSLS